MSGEKSERETAVVNMVSESMATRAVPLVGGIIHMVSVETLNGWLRVSSEAQGSARVELTVMLLRSVRRDNRCKRAFGEHTLLSTLG